jgi:hypothetical protein
LASHARIIAKGETPGPYLDPGFVGRPVGIPLGLDISAAGLTVVRAAYSDLTIELNAEGGPESATVAASCKLDRPPKLLAPLVVTYKGQTLFRGRLEALASELSTGMGFTLTYAGPMVALRDHKAFRCVYVDSDLDSWQTDQGPRSSPDTFEVVSRKSGNT